MSVQAETPHEMVHKLSWQIADLLNGLDPRIEYVTIRASAEGKHAVMTGFDIALSADQTDDPLASLISDYLASVKALNDETAQDRETNERHAYAISEKLEIIEAWDQPAASRETAMMALREADRDMKLHVPDGPAPALVAAALAFFEKEVA